MHLFNWKNKNKCEMLDTLCSQRSQLCLYRRIGAGLPGADIYIYIYGSQQ